MKTKWGTAWQNQQNDMCIQWRHRSAQTDHSLRCPHEEALGPWLPMIWAHRKDSDQTGQMLSFATRTSFCWFCHGAAQSLTVCLKTRVCVLNSLTRASAGEIIQIPAKVSTARIRVLGKLNKISINQTIIRFSPLVVQSSVIYWLLAWSNWWRLIEVMHLSMFSPRGLGRGRRWLGGGILQGIRQFSKIGV